MRSGVWLAMMVSLIAAAPGWADKGPVAVSPGSEAGSVIESRCPTFSWDPVVGSTAHELVVYQVGDEGLEAQPLLERRIPGSASAWTPSMEACLERGGRYAWAVRAVDGRGRPSAWSSPILFEVSAGASATEIRHLLRRLLEAEGSVEELAVGRSSSRAATEASTTPTIGAPSTDASLVAQATGTARAGDFDWIETTPPGTDPRVNRVALAGESFALSTVGISYLQDTYFTNGIFLPVDTLELASGGDLGAEAYEIITTNHFAPQCVEEHRGAIAVMSPSAATVAEEVQDSLCYCGRVLGRYSWWCLNP